MVSLLYINFDRVPSRARMGYSTCTPPRRTFLERSQLLESALVHTHAQHTHVCVYTHTQICSPHPRACRRPPPQGSSPCRGPRGAWPFTRPRVPQELVLHTWPRRSAALDQSEFERAKRLFYQHIQLKLTGSPPMQYSAAQTLEPLNQASMPIIAGQIDEQITSLTSLTHSRALHSQLKR